MSLEFTDSKKTQFHLSGCECDAHDFFLELGHNNGLVNDSNTKYSVIMEFKHWKSLYNARSFGQR